MHHFWKHCVTTKFPKVDLPKKTPHNTPCRQLIFCHIWILAVVKFGNKMILSESFTYFFVLPARMLPNLGNCHLWQKVMKLTCAKTGNVTNLAHFVVANNRKVLSDCQQWQCICFQIWSCQEWLRCVLSDCQKWQCTICFQIWHILELPGMAKVCAQ